MILAKIVLLLQVILVFHVLILNFYKKLKMEKFAQKLVILDIIKIPNRKLALNVVVVVQNA